MERGRKVQVRFPVVDPLPFEDPLRRFIFRIELFARRPPETIGSDGCAGTQAISTARWSFRR